MSKPNPEKCWFHKFLDDPCQAPGIYGRSGLLGGLAESRWCEAHKHEDDIAIQPNDEKWREK